jgi:hypothetical protein
MGGWELSGTAYRARAPLLFFAIPWPFPLYFDFLLTSLLLV